MKKALSVFCLLFSFFVLGQTAVLKLQSKHSSFYKEIKENKRIKVETKEGKIFKGRFKVQDSTSIVIQDQVVLLEDIVTIKKNSMFGTIANPIFITIGAGVFILGASGLFVANPFAAIAGVIAMIGSIPIVAVPLFRYGHPSKNWHYSIIEIK